MFKQGSTYRLKIHLKDKTGRVILPSDVETAEFTFGGVRKATGTGVTYTENAFIVSFTQEETFTFLNGSVRYECRIKLKNGDVTGTNIMTGFISPSLSKEVL